MFKYIGAFLISLFVAATAFAQQTPVTGVSAYFLQPAASDNHATIKKAPGTVYAITAFNNSATVNYLRLYNNAGPAFNGCASATGLIAQYQIPASTAVGGFTANLGPGIAFSAGISLCVTSGYATTDTTNATATAMSITIVYK